ncbi:MAG: hypothetical protein LBJ78_04150 [Puniceicoccales bacterium]|jgi:hypothetical protein|nr:hypothetical protein [Puniceicoccales bacterium]
MNHLSLILLMLIIGQELTYALYKHCTREHVVMKDLLKEAAGIHFHITNKFVLSSSLGIIVYCCVCICVYCQLDPQYHPFAIMSEHVLHQETIHVPVLLHPLFIITLRYVAVFIFVLMFLDNFLSLKNKIINGLPLLVAIGVSLVGEMNPKTSIGRIMFILLGTLCGISCLIHFYKKEVKKCLIAVLSCICIIGACAWVAKKGKEYIHKKQSTPLGSFSFFDRYTLCYLHTVPFLNKQVRNNYIRFTKGTNPIVTRWNRFLGKSKDTVPTNPLYFLTWFCRSPTDEEFELNKERIYASRSSFSCSWISFGYLCFGDKVLIFAFLIGASITLADIYFSTAKRCLLGMFVGTWYITSILFCFPLEYLCVHLTIILVFYHFVLKKFCCKNQ